KSAPLLKKISDWLQLNLDERAALKIVELAIAKISEVRRDRDHELRRRFDEAVAKFVERLRSDPELRFRVQAIRDELLQSPALATYIEGLWNEFREWLAADLAQQPSVTHQKISLMVRAFGEQLDADRE